MSKRKSKPKPKPEPKGEPKPEPKPVPQPALKPKRAGVLSTLGAHSTSALLALVLLPMLVVIFAGSPLPWTTAALSCDANLEQDSSMDPAWSGNTVGAPLCFLLHTFVKGEESSPLWSRLSLALMLGLALLLVQWTLQLACSRSASRVGGLLFLIAVGALGFGQEGPHPLLFTLVPLLASFALIGGFLEERLSWQLALAGTFIGIAVALDPGALGIAAAYLFFLVQLSKNGGKVGSRNLGIFVGGFLLGVLLLGFSFVPTSWPLRYASAYARHVPWAWIDSPSSDWKTLAAAVIFLLFWSLSAKLSQKEGHAQSHIKNWPSLVISALLGGACGALLRPRQCPGDLLVLAPFILFFATPAIVRAAKDIEFQRVSRWSVGAIVLSLAPLSLQATSAIQGLSRSSETTLADEGRPSLEKADARDGESRVNHTAQKANSGIKKPAAGSSKSKPPPRKRASWSKPNRKKE
jgi:hypothetical protein